MTITLDAKDVDARIKNTYKEFANKYNFPGFRKGKAPLPLSITLWARTPSALPSPTKW